jgi:hypothetical protein
VKRKRIDKLLFKRRNKISDNNFIYRLRVREIERIIETRWGLIPDTDDATHTIRLVAQHMRLFAKKPLAGILIHWCRRWAPHMPAKIIRGLAWQVQHYPLKYGADTLAKRLNITFEERQSLRLFTIGAIDRDQAQRRMRRTAEDRKRKERRRKEMRKDSYQTRAEWLEAHGLSRTRPWEIEGMSRAKWYRQRKARETGASARETGWSALSLASSDNTADQPVSLATPVYGVSRPFPFKAKATPQYFVERPLGAFGTLFRLAQDRPSQASPTIETSCSALSYGGGKKFEKVG